MCGGGGGGRREGGRGDARAHEQLRAFSEPHHGDCVSNNTAYLPPPQQNAKNKQTTHLHVPTDRLVVFVGSSHHTPSLSAALMNRPGMGLPGAGGVTDPFPLGTMKSPTASTVSLSQLMS